MTYSRKDIVIGLRWRFENDQRVYTITEFFIDEYDGERYYVDTDTEKNCQGIIEFLINGLNDGTKIIVSIPQNQIPNSYEIF